MPRALPAHATHPTLTSSRRAEGHEYSPNFRLEARGGPELNTRATDSLRPRYSSQTDNSEIASPLRDDKLNIQLPLVNPCSFPPMVQLAGSFSVISSYSIPTGPTVLSVVTLVL